LSEGTYCWQAEIEEKLLELAGQEADDLFRPREKRLEIAYRQRALKVAYSYPTERTDSASLQAEA
jgi:hypothetical protein